MSEGPAVNAAEWFAIGISFGNSNSSIAYTGPDGKAEVIANEEGDRQIPSILSYVDGEEFHGTQAKSQLIRNPRDTVAYFRDYLGKDYTSIDPTPCHQSAHPQQSDSAVAFSIHDANDECPSSITVSEITTRHLRRLKQSASDFLGKAVNAAVITVPTNFSAAQRGALISSAKRAGIEVLQLVHEPVAELMAYDARPETVVVDKLVVVADLGGTRSDASVIASRGGMYTILATAHDYELGGANLDQIIIDHFAKEFMKKHQIDPRENERGLAKLKLEGEATKKALSLGTNATLNIESLTNGIDFSATINRTRYELLAGKVFSQFTNLIEQAVRKAGLDVLDINEVILSGGSSHTPKLASRLQSIFPVTTKILAPSTSPTALNPSDLAARGAAIQASLIQEFDKEDIEQSIHPMVTVTPHLSNAIGVRLLSPSVLGESSPDFQPLIDVETALPARRVAQYRVSNTGGDVLVRVCEGVREIKTIKPMPKPKADTNGGETDADSELESDEEEEEIRQIVWNESRPIAEVALKDVKSGSKVEVVININSDLGLQVTARAIGSRGGVRFAVDAPNVTSDGSIQNFSGS